MQANARGFSLKEQKQCFRLSRVMKNIRMSSDGIGVVLLLSEISCSMAWKTKKLASRTFIHDRQVLKLKRLSLQLQAIIA